MVLPLFAEQPELQCPRGRCDELGHDPLSYDGALGVEWEAKVLPSGGDPSADGPTVASKRSGGLGLGPVEHVPQDEGAEVAPAERMAANEVPKPRAEEAAVPDRRADRGRRVSLQFREAEKRLDLGVREMAGGGEAQEEASEEGTRLAVRSIHWVAHCGAFRTNAASRPRRTALERPTAVGSAPMAEPSLTEHLRRLPLFAQLEEGELATLAQHVRVRAFKRADTIFHKDDAATHLYLVLEGAVKIALPGEFGQEALVAFVRPGEFFGELALIDQAPRSASAVAHEDTRTALLARDDFLPFLEAHPRAVRVVLEALARTIRRLSDRVEDLIFLDVPSRVAKYLLDLARLQDGEKPELILTQDELAAFIGASRVSVNRVLGDLERRSLIAVRRRRIVILDPDGLRAEIRV